VTAVVERAAAGSFLPFTDTSMARRVHREGVLILGGGRALLMQIAHPMVARGVAEHSNFRADRIDRLLRTLRPTLAMVFGTADQALAAAASVNRVHDHITGAGYAAKDPDLLLWVYATLVDTSVVMHERFVRPLSRTEQDRYYEDMRRFASLLSIPPHVMPPTIEDLRAYIAGMCEALTVTHDAREIAEALFHANALTWPVMRSVRTLTAGLLPEGLRAQFGLEWGGSREKALSGFAAASRVLLPRFPKALRAPPWFLMP
jgi:uncharacterized protein (DUF2236 family)